ncbi:hypothetical protein CDEST_14452 [Colletotrichum destructivum]|uniref:Uncharacterized protein n=1 Tax=Colletotrichum destructivum TaxID=34406 RepID=A0AAX4J1Z9_9PEZI|nr:hypothetical protein CDEST_14452 [Colletotrichum destructivum]
MHSTNLLFLFWSLLCCTFAASEKGLRHDNDIYTVEKDGDVYSVYTPYYTPPLQRTPVTKLIFPEKDHDLITVVAAFNGRETRHADGSPRLHLSEVIQAVASSRHANRPLTSINWMRGTQVINEETLAILDRYFDEWRKLNKNAKIPDTFTFTPSSSLWPPLENTSFFKAVKWTFDGTGKTIGSIHISPRKGSRNPFRWRFHGATMSCHLE